MDEKIEQGYTKLVDAIFGATHEIPNMDGLKVALDDQLANPIFTAREKRVLQLRFGLEDGQCRTLEQVGKEFGVTRERIRQIEAKALRKLRRQTRIYLRSAK